MLIILRHFAQCPPPLHIPQSTFACRPPFCPLPLWPCLHTSPARKTNVKADVSQPQNWPEIQKHFQQSKAVHTSELGIRDTSNVVANGRTRPEILRRLELCMRLTSRDAIRLSKPLSLSCCLAWFKIQSSKNSQRLGSPLSPLLCAWPSSQSTTSQKKRSQSTLHLFLDFPHRNNPPPKGERAKLPRYQEKKSAKFPVDREEIITWMRAKRSPCPPLRPDPLELASAAASSHPSSGSLLPEKPRPSQEGPGKVTWGLPTVNNKW